MQAHAQNIVKCFGKNKVFWGKHEYNLRLKKIWRLVAVYKKLVAKLMCKGKLRLE